MHICDCFFRYRILRLLESGLDEVWNRRYFPPAIQVDSLSGENPVTVYDLLGIYFIGIMILALATITLFVETIIARNKNDSAKVLNDSKLACASM